MKFSRLTKPEIEGILTKQTLRTKKNRFLECCAGEAHRRKFRTN